MESVDSGVMIYRWAISRGHGHIHVCRSSMSRYTMPKVGGGAAETPIIVASENIHVWVYVLKRSDHRVVIL